MYFATHIQLRVPHLPGCGMIFISAAKIIYEGVDGYLTFTGFQNLITHGKNEYNNNINNGHHCICGDDST